MIDEALINEGIVEVEGVKVHYLTWGSGQPFVLISGWLGVAENFVPLLRLLPQGYRYLAMSLPGFDSSRRFVGRKYTVAEYAAFLKKFILAMQLERPVLLGISLGASVILDYLITGLGEAEKIILQSPVYRPFDIDLKAKIQIALIHRFRRLTRWFLTSLKYG